MCPPFPALSLSASQSGDGGFEPRIKSHAGDEWGRYTALARCDSGKFLLLLIAGFALRCS